MFAVLKLRAREKDLKSRIRYLFSEPAPLLERINPSGCAPFFVLTVTKDTNGSFDMNTIYSVLGRCAVRLLVEQDVTLPQAERVARFEPELFPALLLFNSAVKLLAGCAVAPEKRVVAVVDPSAILQERILPLVHEAAVLKIITLRPQKYEALAQRVLDEWGLALVIRGDCTAAADCDALIAPFYSQDFPWSETVALRQSSTGRLMRFVGEGITLPPDLQALLPEKIDPLLFAAALYELCCATQLSAMRYDRMKTAGLL